MNRLFLLLVLVAPALCAATFGSPPYVIGHRGSSGIFPEHTAAAYQRAIDDGADFIECDVVPTKDCVLICRHEPELNLTTDANKLYPTKGATYNVDGTNVTGIFSFDLTYDEVKKLRAIQPRDYRNQAYNGLYPVVTLEEYIAIAQSASRPVGIYPETKHPSFHDSLGLKCFANSSFSEAVLKTLESKGYKGPYNSTAWLSKPVFIQSFERKNLELLKKKTDIPLVQLLDEWDAAVPYDNITYGDMATPQGLKAVAKYAAGLGPWKGSYVVANSTNYVGSVNADFIDAAHAAGLQLHPYTFRNEDRFLAWDYAGDINNEYDLHFGELGIDGAFTDFPATLVRYLNELFTEQK